VFSIADHTYMALALQIAEQGNYSTAPNPRVACVVVKNNQILGQAAHLKAGQAHAEVLALNQAGAGAAGADVYVTLEPCNHLGRTPPCVDALLNAGVKRVVVAMQDPNPLVAGQGMQRLQSAGIQVELGLLEAQAQALNPGFVSRMTRQRPYLRAKLAASLDGRTALANGLSQWITTEAARADVQHWRAMSCAIVTGIGTVLQDNPSMTLRAPDLVRAALSRQPLRVIVDSQLRTPVDCQMLSAASLQTGPVLIAYAKADAGQLQKIQRPGLSLVALPNADGQVDLPALLNHLAKLGINEALLEAGAALNGAFLQAQLIDEFIFYYAAKLMGGTAQPMFAIPPLAQMSQAQALQILDVRQLGADIRLRAKPVPA
jgi:diaminohydroxyphosphoribosylaminopyrimidine deaminase/5-amino-6-(5-phosphoribosylamino)uracil reductase